SSDVCSSALPGGESVGVSFAGQEVGTTAGADGRWVVVLSPLAANPTGAELTVAGNGRAVARDVAGGGGANMELTMDSAAAKVPGARLPLLRQFKVGLRASPAPLEAAAGDWTPCSPETVGRFSAAGYFFAHELLDRLSAPVGIINSTCTDAPIESWMS